MIRYSYDYLHIITVINDHFYYLLDLFPKEDRSVPPIFLDRKLDTLLIVDHKIKRLLCGSRRL